MTFKIWPKWLFIGVADEDPRPRSCRSERRSRSVWPVSCRSGAAGQRPWTVHRPAPSASSVWWRPGDQGGKTIWCRFDRDGVTTERKPN